MAQLLATGPIVLCGNGLAARRTVLKGIYGGGAKLVEFIVHRQYFYEDGTTAYEHGNYFPVFGKDFLEVQKRAWGCFVERSEKDLEYSLAELESDPVRFGSVLESHKVSGKG